MKVTIILPTGGHFPIGGYKVAYEYANGLERSGHRVRVIHAAYLPARRSSTRGLLRDAIVKYAWRSVTKHYRPDNWFRVAPGVELRWVPSLDSPFIPSGDAVIATSWRTAEYVASYPPRTGRKFYLIQHLETWGGPRERVINTWQLPLERVVIARWLQEFGEELGVDSHYVPNGLDFNAFGVDTPIEERPPLELAMLNHPAEWKGTRDGLGALELVARNHPDLKVHMFGVSAKPGSLASFVNYHENPPQQELRQIYNRASIFVSPSWAEGWPLPPAEAMMSGCALAATDIGGHREYALHERTALLSPVKSPHILAENIERLLNSDLRLRIAQNGNRHIQQFTWSRAVSALERILAGAPGP